MQSGLYSLWLLFPDDAAQDFRNQITNLSGYFGGPVFEPHITLASDLEWDDVLMFEQQAQHCRTAEAPIARLNDIQTGNSYFQSVYFTLALPEKLAQLRLDAYAHKNVQPAFPPHISLVYGDAPDALNAPLVQAIGQTYRGISLPLDSVALVASSEDRPIEDWEILRKTSLCL